jgi:hypothetical protein
LALASIGSAQSRSNIFIAHSNGSGWTFTTFSTFSGNRREKTRVRLREAVRNAPTDAEHGLQTVMPDEREAWADAVNFYSQGLSRRDPTTDEPLAHLMFVLAGAGDSRDLRRTTVDVDVCTTLERATAVYRKVWWPMHLAANRDYEASLQRLLAQHGSAIRDFITSRYEFTWPANLSCSPFLLHELGGGILDLRRSDSGNRYRPAWLTH